MLNNLLDRNMRTIYYYICFVLGLVGFVACSEDNGEFPDVPDGELCSLTIQLGAANNQETRVGGDDNALEGEFINSLWVFITDDKGVVEKKLTLSDGSTSTVSPSTATGGNILEWWHTIEDLPVGNKIIYAFANMEKVSPVSPVSNESQNMSTLLSGIQEGANLSSIVDELVINDPASTVNIASGQYIPMSLKKRVTVTGDQTIRVELVRLVGRVDIQLKNAKASPVTVTSFTMGQFADRVALMPGGTDEIITYNTTYSTFGSPSTIEAGKSHTFQFYVNETKNANATTGFSIGLQTADDKNYSATTRATAIPRNHILPLNLTISESDLNLIVTAYIAPIGGYPVQVYTSGDLTQAAAYSVTLPEGCTFRVTGTLADGTTGTCVLDYVETTDQNENIEIDATNKSVAYVTALPDLADITPLEVSLMDGDVKRATCTLNVSTEALKDWGEGGYPISSSLRQWQAAPAWYEVVPLRMANPE